MRIAAILLTIREYRRARRGRDHDYQHQVGTRHQGLQHPFVRPGLEQLLAGEVDGTGGEERDPRGGAGLHVHLPQRLAYDSTIFKAATPPKNLARATYGAALEFGAAGNLPSLDSAIQAATRVVSPVERQAVVDVPYGGKGAMRLVIAVWVNDTLVFKMDANRKREANPFLLRKTGNTLVVECRSDENGAATLGEIGLKFNDAQDGKPLNDLLFDMETR